MPDISYSPLTWHDKTTATDTPTSAANFNRIETGIVDVVTALNAFPDMLVLGPDDDVPGGTAVGTIIIRTVAPSGSPAVLGTPVLSNTANNQTNTSLAVGLGTTVAGDLRIVILSGSAASGGVGVDPTITTPSGWTKLGQVVDTNSGTGTSSSFLAVYWRKVVSGDSTSQTFSWTTACNLIAVMMPFSGQDPTSPLGTFFSAEKSASDVNYSITGTTDITGLLVSVFANRTASTAWTSLVDDDAGANSNSGGPTIACRITATEVASGTAFTKTAVGTNTSIGATAAFVVKGTD